MGRKSDKALEEVQKAAGMQQVTVFELLLWSSVPYWICMILYKAGQIESLSEAQSAGKVGVAAALLLNLFLIVKGSYKLVLKRHKKGKNVLEGAGDAVKTAGKAVAGATVAKTAVDIAREGARQAAGNSGGKVKWSSSDPDWMTVKDPATGAESAYKLNSDGEWVNVETGSVLNTDSLGDWFKQRESDSKWVEKQNEKIRNHETAFDDKLNDMRKQAEAEQKKLDEEAKHKMDILKKYGTLDDSPENIKKIIERDQRINEIESRLETNRGNIYAILESGATWTLKAADYAIDVLAEVTSLTNPAGKHIIKNGYMTARNFTARLSDAYVNGKDMGFAARQAMGDSVVDIVQNEVSTKGYGYQFAANAGGDSYKAAMQALADGEDPVEAGLVGFWSGSAKTGAGFFIDQGTGMAQKAMRNSYTGKMLDLNKKLMNGELKQSVYKGTSQVLTKQLNSSVNTLNNVTKTLVSDVTNDVNASVNDALFNTHRKLK